MKVEMLQSEWGNEKVNNDYHVTLYRMSDEEGDKTPLQYAWM